MDKRLYPDIEVYVELPRWAGCGWTPAPLADDPPPKWSIWPIKSAEEAENGICAGRTYYLSGGSHAGLTLEPKEDVEFFAVEVDGRQIGAYVLDSFDSLRWDPSIRDMNPTKGA